MDPLFHRPGPMRIVLQKFFIVVRFDHERVHLAQTLDQHLRGVAEIGDISETARTGVKREADRIDRVMRHGKVWTVISQMENSEPVRKRRQFR